MTDKIFGIDLALYKIHALKNGIKVGTMKSIDYTKLGAYCNVAKYFPDHNGFDYEHVRFAEDGEEVGPVLEKNDFKRK